MDRVHGGGPWIRGPCFVLSLEKSMSRDHTSPNPFLDSSYSRGHPVQFPLQGNAGPLRQTGHATEKNNYVGGAAAQFPDLAIERSAASGTINRVVEIKTTISFFVLWPCFFVCNAIGTA